jgi:hypothetical protein
MMPSVKTIGLWIEGGMVPAATGLTDSCSVWEDEAAFRAGDRHGSLSALVHEESRDGW